MSDAEKVRNALLAYQAAMRALHELDDALDAQPFVAGDHERELQQLEQAARWLENTAIEEGLPEEEVGTYGRRKLTGHEVDGLVEKACAALADRNELEACWFLRGWMDTAMGRHLEPPGEHEYDASYLAGSDGAKGC